jgi:LytS/YehU family sensor histidine kinase
MIPLRAELDIVRSYVEIERVRFADRLAVDIDVDVSVLDVPVPAMILQPVVENAVRHAVAMRDEPTTVTIAARSGAGALVLSVDDDGPGPVGARSGLGLGLTNIRARLAEAYGEAHGFAAGALPNGGFRVEITVPTGSSASPIARRAALEPQPA